MTKTMNVIGSAILLAILACAVAHPAKAAPIFAPVIAGGIVLAIVITAFDVWGKGSRWYPYRQ